MTGFFTDLSMFAGIANKTEAEARGRNKSKLPDVDFSYSPIFHDFGNKIQLGTYRVERNIINYTGRDITIVDGNGVLIQMPSIRVEDKRKLNLQSNSEPGFINNTERPAIYIEYFFKIPIYNARNLVTIYKDLEKEGKLDELKNSNKIFHSLVSSVFKHWEGKFLSGTMFWDTRPSPHYGDFHGDIVQKIIVPIYLEDISNSPKGIVYSKEADIILSLEYNLNLFKYHPRITGVEQEVQDTVKKMKEEMANHGSTEIIKVVSKEPRRVYRKVNKKVVAIDSVSPSEDTPDEGVYYYTKNSINESSTYPEEIRLFVDLGNSKELEELGLFITAEAAFHYSSDVELERLKIKHSTELNEIKCKMEEIKLQHEKEMAELKREIVIEDNQTKVTLNDMSLKTKIIETEDKADARSSDKNSKDIAAYAAIATAGATVIAVAAKTYATTQTALMATAVAASAPVVATAAIATAVVGLGAALCSWLFD